MMSDGDTASGEGSSVEGSSVEGEFSEDDDDVAIADAPGPPEVPSSERASERSHPSELWAAVKTLDRLKFDLASTEDCDATPGVLRDALFLFEDASFLDMLLPKTDVADLEARASFLKSVGELQLEVFKAQKRKDRLDRVKDLEAEVRRLQEEVRGLNLRVVDT